MKYLYIALNILFITVIVIASRSYFASTDQSHISKTKNSKQQSTHLVKSKQNRSIKTVRPLNANIAVQHNLFNPNRGGSANSATGIKKSSRRNSYAAQQFKLVGVYRFGKNHGAIIISSNQRSSSRSRRSSRTSSRSSSALRPSKVKRFYRIGDLLANGFVLKKVETRTVVLSKGSEIITLEIAHNNPTTRESSRSKNSAKRVSMKVSRPTYNMPGQMTRPGLTEIN